jgi:hypothetical protein
MSLLWSCFLKGAWFLKYRALAGRLTTSLILDLYFRTRLLWAKSSAEIVLCNGRPPDLAALAACRYWFALCRTTDAALVGPHTSALRDAAVSLSASTRNRTSSPPAPFAIRSLASALAP